MVKTIKLLLGCALASASLFATTSAQAFCVQNTAGGVLRVFEQMSAGMNSSSIAFDQAVKKGDNKCCNWQNKDCNPSGKQTNLIGMYVFVCSFEGLSFSETRTFKDPSGWGLYGEQAGDPVCSVSGSHFEPKAFCGLTGDEINAITQPKLPTITQNKGDRIVLLQAGGWLELANINGSTVLKSFLNDGKVLYTFPCYKANVK